MSNRTGRILDWEFARDGQKVVLTLDGVFAVNDHEAYVAGMRGHMRSLVACLEPCRCDRWPPRLTVNNWSQVM
jgi:hypothetical protein